MNITRYSNSVPRIIIQSRWVSYLHTTDTLQSQNCPWARGARSQPWPWSRSRETNHSKLLTLTDRVLYKTNRSRNIDRTQSDEDATFHRKRTMRLGMTPFRCGKEYRAFFMDGRSRSIAGAGGGVIMSKFAFAPITSVDNTTVFGNRVISSKHQLVPSAA